MRRDIGFYLEANIEQVYTAYLKAAVNPPFERDCKQEPFHTISFGLNWSFKYNMNGGACTIHMMPYGTGTAVNMRFTLVQASGARYGRYAEDLNIAVQKFLPVVIGPLELDMEIFMKPENQIVPTAQRPAVQAPSAPVTGGRFCTNCGNTLTESSRFCSRCGTQVSAPPTQKICPNCQKPVNQSAAFCTACGTKL